MTGYVRNDGALGSARKILNSSRWIRREKNHLKRVAIEA